jgi:hypothetical protein
MDIRTFETVNLIRLSGILIETPYSNPNGDGPWTLQLSCPSGEVAVVTDRRAHVARPELDRVRKVSIMLRVEDTGPDQAPFYLIEQVDEQPQADIFRLMPDGLGPVTGNVTRLKALVDGLHCSPLRRFLSEVFTLETVYRYFWTCPASHRDHHDRAGGLACHSLDMAEQVASIEIEDPVQRDLAVADALVHDIGKVWTHGAPSQSSLPRLGHEILGIQMMAPAIARLGREWEDGATAILDMLHQGVPYRPRPLMPIASVVAGLDACSALRDLANYPNKRRRRVWVPRWEDQEDLVL